MSKAIVSLRLWWQLDSNREREAALQQTATKAQEACRKAQEERDSLETGRKEAEEELVNLKQAVRGAMLELANQKQRSEMEVGHGQKVNKDQEPSGKVSYL